MEGTVSDNEKTETKAKRPRPKGGVIMYFDEPTTARLNQHQRRLEQANPGVKLDRKSVLHNLLLLGLDAAEAADDAATDGGGA